MFAKKLLFFLQGTQEISIAEKVKFVVEFGEKNQDNGYAALLSIIDRLDNANKINIMVALMKARIYGHISIEDFIRTAFALERIPYPDISELEHYTEDYYKSGSSDILYSAGVVKTSAIGDGPTKYRLNPIGCILMKYGLGQEVENADEECTAPQKLDTFGVFFMKYNYEIRLKAVKLVLEGGLSVREAGCHLGCGRSQVHLWVTLFERHGLTGLKLRHGSYSAEFKLSVLKHMHQNHLSLLETAVHFGIPGPFVIRQWERLYQNQGAEGLRRKPQRRRPAMSKSKTKKVKLKTTPHEELLKELEYLRAENAYLKKLQALVEERIVRESGKEPKPSKD